MLEHAASALFADPGIGKTSITLAAIKILKKKNLVNKVLIIAPLRVCQSVWVGEVNKWSDFSSLNIVVLHGPDKEQLLHTKADIYVTNPESLDWLLQTTKTKHVSAKTGKITTKISIDKKRWKMLDFDVLIVDELSKFKHTNTNRFKSIKLVLGSFSRIWGLTGSPVANGLMDLFGQCYIIDQGRTLGPYITGYRNEYFNPSHDGFSWTIKDGAESEIYKRIAPLALRMSADDYLDMPQLIENNIYVELPSNVRSFYDHLEDDLIAKIGDRVITASTAAVASVKCRQVASGGIYVDDEVKALFKLPKKSKEWINLHYEKVDALVDLIEELQGSPLLVAYDFSHDLDRLRERLGKDIPYIGGGISTKRFAELERAWNSGNLPYLFGQPQAMAYGLNLQEVGHHVAWHSMTFNYELYDQFVRRVLRQGNTHKKVFVHRILAAGTVDTAMLSAIKSKRTGQNVFFEALKNLRKKL